MPINANQLLDWAAVRSVIDTSPGGGRYWVWLSSDPGTGTLPDNRISTVGEITAYLWTESLGNPSNFCPDFTTFGNMISDPSVAPINLQAVSDENRFSFDLDADGYPSGATIDYNVYINGVFQGNSTGNTPGAHVDFGTGGAMSPGDDVSVDVFLKYLGSTIATGSDSTTAS
jgi:hypothetical protein